MKPPVYSVIIPTLNEEKFLPHLLDSLAKQTSRDFEVIVSDGRSKDRTVAIAKTFKQKLTSLQVVVAPKASLPFQRNFGAKHARGDWYVFIDADSILLPNFFERVKLFISAYQPQLFTTWCRPDSEVNGDALLTLLVNMFWEGSLLFKRQLAPGPLAIVTRKAFDSVNGYNPTLSFGEDFDFSQRLARKGIQMNILRESLFVVSLRRFRKEGKLKALQIYAKVSLLTLFTKKPPKNVPGYIMGGQFYDKKKMLKKPALRMLEAKLKKLIQEVFG